MITGVVGVRGSLLVILEAVTTNNVTSITLLSQRLSTLPFELVDKVRIIQHLALVWNRILYSKGL